MGGDGKLQPLGQPLKPECDRGQLQTLEKIVTNPNITTVETTRDHNATFADQPNPDNARNVIGAIPGASFSNTDYLPHEKEEMEHRLREGR